MSKRFVVFRISPAELNRTRPVREYLQPYHVGIDWSRNIRDALVLDDEYSANDLARSVNRASSGMGGCAQAQAIDCYCFDHPTFARTFEHPHCPTHKSQAEPDDEPRYDAHHRCKDVGSHDERCRTSDGPNCQPWL